MACSGDDFGIYVVSRIPATVPLTYIVGDAMAGSVVLRGKSAMQLYARNMMAVIAASAVLAAGVLAAAPVEVSAGPLGLRTVSAPVELTTGVADCLAYGVCGIYDVAQVALAVPAYAVTYAGLLATDVIAVVGAAVAYGATVTAAVAVGPVLHGIAVPECGGSFCGDVASAPTVMMARAKLEEDVARLKADWALARSPANFASFVTGLTPAQGAASLASRHSTSAKAAVAHAKPAAARQSARTAAAHVQPAAVKSPTAR
jgi:hypothetical protein